MPYEATNAIFKRVAGGQLTVPEAQVLVRGLFAMGTTGHAVERPRLPRGRLRLRISRIRAAPWIRRLVSMSGTAA